jgi:hypothetical protein
MHCVGRTYRAVNTLRLGYKNESVNAVQWNNRCFFSDPHKTHKHINKWNSSSSIRHLQPLRVWACSFLRLHDHTQRHNTVGRTPLDEWSARHRDLYLTKHTTLTTENIHVSGGIRTRYPSRRSSADPHLRPLTGMGLIMELIPHS